MENLSLMKSEVMFNLQMLLSPSQKNPEQSGGISSSHKNIALAKLLVLKSAKISYAPDNKRNAHGQRGRNLFGAGFFTEPQNRQVT